MKKYLILFGIIITQLIHANELPVVSLIKSNDIDSSLTIDCYQTMKSTKIQGINDKGNISGLIVSKNNNDDNRCYNHLFLYDNSYIPYFVYDIFLSDNDQYLLLKVNKNDILFIKIYFPNGIKQYLKDNVKAIK